MYKNFIFDLYGTLINILTDEYSDIFWEKIAFFYSYNGAIYYKDELKTTYFSEVKKLLEENQITSFPDIDILKIFYKLYRIKKIIPNNNCVIYTAKLFRILSTKEIKLYSGVYELLEYLTDNKKKVIILSNGQRAFSIPEIKYFDIHKYFDSMYFSSDMGICKPDKQFMEYLISKERIKIEESIMIGNDHRTDIAIANAVNMDSLYIFSNLSGILLDNLECKYKILDSNISKIKSLIVI